jgi:hypothetical protein
MAHLQNRESDILLLDLADARYQRVSKCCTYLQTSTAAGCR